MSSKNLGNGTEKSASLHTVSPRQAHFLGRERRWYHVLPSTRFYCCALYRPRPPLEPMQIQVEELPVAGSELHYCTIPSDELTPEYLQIQPAVRLILLSSAYVPLHFWPLADASIRDPKRRIVKEVCISPSKQTEAAVCSFPGTELAHCMGLPNACLVATMVVRSTTEQPRTFQGFTLFDDISLWLSNLIDDISLWLLNLHELFSEIWVREDRWVCNLAFMQYLVYMPDLRGKVGGVSEQAHEQMQFYMCCDQCAVCDRFVPPSW